MLQIRGTKLWNPQFRGLEPTLYGITVKQIIQNAPHTNPKHRNGSGRLVTGDGPDGNQMKFFGRENY